MMLGCRDAGMRKLRAQPTDLHSVSVYTISPGRFLTLMLIVRRDADRERVDHLEVSGE